MDDMFQNTGDERTNVIGMYFQHKDVNMLKQMSELDPPLVFPVSFMQFVGRRFKSKVLPGVCKEIYLHKNSQDRQGRIEFGEVVGAMRRAEASEED